MTSIAAHPALVLLVRQRAAGRLRRLRENLLAPRKLLLTLAALSLAVLWLANAVTTVLYREAYEPETFRRTASLVLLGYFLWQVVKVAASRPTSPIEWSPAERHFLLAGPFARRELLAYRIALALPGTAFKAVCVSLFFLPEIRAWWAGFLGAFLGFLFLELLRLAVAFGTCRLSRRTFAVARWLVLGTTTFVGIAALARVLGDVDALAGEFAAWKVVTRFAGELAAFRDTLPGRLMEAPFLVFARLLVCEHASEAFVWSLAAAALCLAAGGALFALSAFDRDDDATDDTGAARTLGRGGRATCWRPIPRWHGTGPIVWRQLHAARRHRQGVLLALVPPIVLASTPLLLPLDPLTTFANVAAAAAFYSFVLLPSALKFDFRTEYRRLHVLKSLPLAALTVAVAEIAVPVAITLIYQAVVLVIACWMRPVPVAVLLATASCLVPTTVAIYALENLLYLFAPQPPKQEGLEVLLKGVLTFTAKGLVFACGVAAVLAWFWVSIQLDVPGWGLDRRFVFGTGLVLIATGFAALLTGVLARTYAGCEFDASSA